jgi:hypothetical protein
MFADGAVQLLGGEGYVVGYLLFYPDILPQARAAGFMIGCPFWGYSTRKYTQ